MTQSDLLHDEIDVLCNDKTTAFIVLIVLAFLIFLMTLAGFLIKLNLALVESLGNI